MQVPTIRATLSLVSLAAVALSSAASRDDGVTLTNTKYLRDHAETRAFVLVQRETPVGGKG